MSEHERSELSTRAARLLSMIRDRKSAVYEHSFNVDGPWMRLLAQSGVGKKTLEEMVMVGILIPRSAYYGDAWYRLATPAIAPIPDCEDFGDLWVADA